MEQHMYGEVELPVKPLSSHAQHAGQEAVDTIRQLASSMQGLRVLHVNSTSYGGGVAELLYTIVPLMRDAGLDAGWHAIQNVPAQFFDITKKIHNTLQGSQDYLSEAEWELYEDVNRKLAQSFPAGPWDIVIMHDPQPLAARAFMENMPAHRRPAVRHWVWRCHIDLSTPNPRTWDKLWPYINHYDGAIVTSKAYARDEITATVFEITPSIDPTSPKNTMRPTHDVHQVLASFGVDASRPLMLQVSRFDPWKDPFGVVEAYRLVKQHEPRLQLAMVGSIAADDPEGVGILEKLKAAARSDSDIHVLSNEDGVHASEVSAFQQGADVVVQKSSREGFGLTITEAMWKGQPVVAGDATGCRLQITNGQDGFITSTTDECAHRVSTLLDDASLRLHLGAVAHNTVRNRFLSTGHVAKYLELFAKLG